MRGELALLITEKHVHDLLSVEGFVLAVVDAMEEAHRQLRQGRLVQVPRAHLQATHDDPRERHGRWFRMLPAMSEEWGAAVRVYTLFPENLWTGNRELLLLFSPSDGQLEALISDHALHALRTGGPSGVVCRYAAPTGQTPFAIIGSGRQARGMAVSIAAAVPDQIEEIRVWSPTTMHRERFASEMATHIQHVAVRAARSREAALEGAGLVALATSSPNPVVAPESIRDGALVISIRNGQIDPRLVVQASPVILSDRHQARAYDPPLAPYSELASSGSWSWEEAVEIADLVLGEVVIDREGPTRVAEMAGMGAWDLAAARVLYDQAVSSGVGQEFSLTGSGNTDRFRPFVEG